MKLLKRLAIRNLILNKKMTITIIIGIVLSSFLITNITTLVSSFLQTMIEYQKKIEGNYHYEILDINKKDLENIQMDNNVEKTFVTQDIGYTKISNNKFSKPYGYIIGFSNEAFDNLNIEIIEGRLPKNKNEIVIQRQMITIGEVNWKIGDEITIGIGEREKNGRKLNQSDIYIDGEKIIYKNYYTYKIVGIIGKPNTNVEPLKALGYTMITYLDDIEDNLNVYIRYNNLNNINKSSILNNYKYAVNNTLVKLESRSLGEETMKVIYLIAIIIIIIIAIASVYCIKNSFQISITEKVKQYGMLLSIGATSKQIKYSVLFEGFIMAIIAIPTGITLGVFLIFILFNILGKIFEDNLLGINFVFSINTMAIILTIILNILIVYLVSKKSAKEASKILPIEAIKSSKDIKANFKFIQSPKIIKKIFGIGGVIAYKNLKRNKRKYRTAVTSIVISIISFISMMSFVQCALKTTDNYYNYTYNLFIDTKENNYELLKKIAKSLNSDSYSIIRKTGLVIRNEDDKEDYRTYSLYSIGQQEYLRFIQQLGLNYEDTKDKLIWLSKESKNSLFNNSNVDEIIRNTQYKKGDTIRGEIKGETISLDIAIIEENIRPMGMEVAYNNCAIISEEFWEKHKLEIEDMDNVYMFINTENADKVEEYINKNYSSIELNISNMEVPERNQKALWILVSSFLYEIIIAISLIGITNIFNIITTSMKLRQKEFANLKSVGMTEKEFNNMIILESIFLGLKSLIIGVPLGILGSYIIYKIFSLQEKIEYILPLNGIIFIVIVVCILIISIMKYSLNKINKQNIIETIRKDNI